MNLVYIYLRVCVHLCVNTDNATFISSMCYFRQVPVNLLASVRWFIRPCISQWIMLISTRNGHCLLYFPQVGMVMLKGGGADNWGYIASANNFEWAGIFKVIYPAESWSCEKYGSDLSIRSFLRLNFQVSVSFSLARNNLSYQINRHILPSNDLWQYPHGMLVGNWSVRLVRTPFCF